MSRRSSRHNGSADPSYAPRVGDFLVRPRDDGKWVLERWSGVAVSVHPSKQLAIEAGKRRVAPARRALVQQIDGRRELLVDFGSSARAGDSSITSMLTRQSISP